MEEIVGYFVGTLQETGYLKEIALPPGAIVVNALKVSETVHLHVRRRNDQSTVLGGNRYFVLVPSFYAIPHLIIDVIGSFERADGMVIHLIEVATNR